MLINRGIQSSRTFRSRVASCALKQKPADNVLRVSHHQHYNLYHIQEERLEQQTWHYCEIAIMCRGDGECRPLGIDLIDFCLGICANRCICHCCLCVTIIVELALELIKARHPFMSWSGSLLRSPVDSFPWSLCLLVLPSSFYSLDV
ncbi:uncharacterized protein LOC120003808 [Tripterygium wilfordii]|uniref:uncharacterized protein LOC120003808 n=1 Tax=Tripterygium wilfordii TaxID=458696 RepID=UPI0018F809CB|nr:uncharacterized protein LOC120003808 [Tripterygium wilfordii]